RRKKWERKSFFTNLRQKSQLKGGKGHWGQGRRFRRKRQQNSRQRTPLVKIMECRNVRYLKTKIPPKRLHPFVSQSGR
ncbi:unnamed protein product, partial [Musa textilis]